jgi:capsular exopolysaccharide synthesis family protein
MGELPGQTDANLATLHRLQLQLSDVEERLQHKADRRVAVQQQITAYETLGLAMFTFPQGNESPDKSVVLQGRANRAAQTSDPLYARLKELEKTFSALKAEYKDTYPDVIQARKEMAQIQSQIAERNQSNSNLFAHEPIETAKPQYRSERSVTTEMDPYLLELKRELNENDIGSATLKEQQILLKAQFKDFEARVEKAPEREQEMTTLQRDYENNKKNYSVLLEKQLNAKISENLEKRQKGEKFRILDPANLPTRPVSPDKPKIMLVGLFLGLFLGGGGAFALELLSGVIRRPEEAETLLGLPILASIPHFMGAYLNGASKALPGPSASTATEPPKPGTSVSRAALVGMADSNLGRTSLRLPWNKTRLKDEYVSKGSSSSNSVMLELNLVTKWRPLSLVAEQFRVAATRLVLSSANEKNSIIIVTSAVSGEGKSSTASNLAYVLAQDLGKQTVLVDCDFKRPILHAYTGVPLKPGLAEAIYGEAPLETCLHQCGDIPLRVLPSGGRGQRLVDLTKIPEISGILNELKTRFEFIILDAPPILPLADVNLLASMADMLVLVVRAGAAHHELVQRSLKAMKPLSRAGVIFAGYDQESDRSNYRYSQDSYRAS